MPKTPDLSSLQAEVKKEVERDSSPEAKKHAFGVVEGDGPIEAEVHPEMQKYADMVEKYSEQLSAVKKELIAGNKNKSVRAMEAPLVTLISSAEKLQAIFNKTEPLTEAEKRRVRTLESIIKINTMKLKSVEADKFMADNQAELREAIAETIVERDAPKVKEEPISAPESFKNQNQDLLREMDMLDGMIAARSAGVGGFFKKMFSSELKEMKKRRHELMLQMEERVSGPAIDRVSVRKAKSRGPSQIIDPVMPKSRGESFMIPKGRKVTLEEEPTNESEYIKMTPEQKKEMQEYVKRNRKIDKELSKGIPKAVALEDQKLDKNDEDLIKFKKQQRGFGGFLKRFFYNADEKMELADSENVHNEIPMTKKHQYRRNHITSSRKAQIDKNIRNAGKGTMS